jgi:hypothetical protein
VRSRSYGLFLISVVIVILTLLASILFRDILNGNFIPVGISVSIAFGISIAGIIIGIGERKKSNTLKTWIGIVGNFIVVALYALAAINSMKFP